MSVPEFRDIFHREIETYLHKLREHRSKGGSGAASCAYGNENQAPISEEEQLHTLRSLAHDMTENIMKRVVDYAAADGLQVSTDAASTAALAGSCAASMARLQELEARVAEARAEEERRHVEYLSRAKEKHAASLAEHERAIREAAQKRIDEAGASASGAGLKRAAELCEQFAESARTIEAQVADTKDVIKSLAAKRQRLDRVEAMQRRPPTAVEQLLGSQEAEDRFEVEDGEAREILAEIRRHDQVSSRMRRRHTPPSGR